MKIKEGQSKTNQGIKSKSHVVCGFPEGRIQKV